jgi:hypothetical protein
MGLLKIVPPDTVYDQLLREFSGDCGGRPIKLVGRAMLVLLSVLCKLYWTGRWDERQSRVGM